MAKRFTDCIAEAVRNGVISPEDGDYFRSWYAFLRKEGKDESAALGDIAAGMEAEAARKDRVKALAARVIAIKKREALAWRNADGTQDIMQGIQALLFRRGDEGRFVGLDAASLEGLSFGDREAAILRSALTRMEEVAHVFRRGALTGDIKRSARTLGKLAPSIGKTIARLDEVSKAMRGEAVSDPYAKQLAEIMMTVAEELRVRFNEAGGHIGKLEGWGGPQAHDADAIRAATRDVWVRFTMQHLDRERMGNRLTGAKLSDDELIKSLQYAWETITMGGRFDEESISGAPSGVAKSLANQHADHRFLHFTADGWQAYAMKYGNRDPYAAFMIWIRVMARDIAAMESFGPNPNTTVNYLLNWATIQARKVQPTEIIIAESKARLAALKDSLLVPNPELEAASARFDEITAAMEAIRSKYAPQLGGKPSRRNKARLEALQTELNGVVETLKPFWSGDKPRTVEDARVQGEFNAILEDMRTEIAFAATHDPVSYANARRERIEQLWSYMSGATNVPVNQKAADYMAAARSFVAATALPMAVISALSDATFTTIRNGFVGMSARQANPITSLVQTIKYAASNMSRREAMQAGAIVDTVIPVWRREASEALLSAKVRSTSNYIADRVLSLSWLTPYTTGGKLYMQMGIMAHVANQMETAWPQLDGGTRAMLQRAGFDAAGWDMLRSAETHDLRSGAPVLSPADVAKINPALAERYAALISRETAYGVMEANAQTRSMILQGTRPGTVTGEIVRGGMLFKGWPIAVLFYQWGQVSNLARAGDTKGAASYVASLMILGGLMGAVSMSLKDVAAGRDPRKMLDEKTLADGNFWMAALLQAGGLGIWGDFVFSDANRFGGGPAQTLAGPLVDRLNTLRRLTIGNVQQAVQGKPTHFGREMTRFLRQNVPNVLLTKLATERLVWDQMQRLVDPEAQRAFQQDMNRRKRDYGQDYFWAPGTTSPQRAPDITRPFATRN